MQSIKTRLTKSLIIIVLAGIMLVTPLSQVSATSNSLGVNPRRDYTVKSGEKVQDTLFVSNLSKTDDLIITIRAIDFGAKNQTGSPELLLKQTEPTRWSLKPYLTIPPSVTIAAGKSASVPFTIAIPKNVGAGSYYSAVQYSTSGDTNTDSNVSLTSSSATLVFVRVPGEANDILRLNRFGAFTPYASGDDGTFGSFYGGSSPKYLAYRLENKGNVAEQPTGSVIVKNIFGKQVKLFEKVNPNNNIVLIDQTRRFDLCLNEERSSHPDPATGRNVDVVKCNQSHFAPGRYTARLALVYGDNGSSSHELGAVTSFWYLPIWFLAVAAVVLLLLVAIIWFVVRKISLRGRRNSNHR